MEQETERCWLIKKYPNNIISGVGATFNLIFINNKLSRDCYCKVFTLKDKKMKGKAFFIAVQGFGYQTLIKKHFGAFDKSLPPPRDKLVRVCGATIDLEWMFSNLENIGEIKEMIE
ncbi:MAG: hypothetical protein WKF68_04900 [Daejeonella sp.]